MKKRRPSLKQKLFAKKYVDNLGNGTQAALEVYNVKDRANASNVSIANLKKPIIREEIKKILERKGVNLETMTDNLKEAIELNLHEGKPSMSVGADLLKFAYKLHDVIPGNKNLNLNLSRKEVVEDKSYDEVKEELSKLQKMTQKLIDSTP